MALGFLKSLISRPAAAAKPMTAGSPGSQLSKITAAYRAQQANQTTTSSQTIDQLSAQRRRLATAEVGAEKPVSQYLQRSGQMVEQRIGSLQAHVNQLLGKNKS